MKLAELKDALNNQGNAPRKAAEYLIYMPPSGAPVECPDGFDIVQAGAAASRLAARHPGSTVAVYALVGTAVTPIVEPVFVPTSNEPFLIASPEAKP